MGIIMDLQAKGINNEYQKNSAYIDYNKNVKRADIPQGLYIYEQELPDGQQVSVSSIYYYPNGALKSVTIPYSTKQGYFRGIYSIKVKLPDGNMARPHSISYYENGKIKSVGKLHQGYNSKVTLPDGTTHYAKTSDGLNADETISYFESGKIKKFSSDDRDELKIILPDGRTVRSSVTSYYESGKIQSIKIPNDTKIKLATGEEVAVQEISFFENGSIKQVKLENSLEISFDN